MRTILIPLLSLGVASPLATLTGCGSEPPLLAVVGPVQKDDMLVTTSRDLNQQAHVLQVFDLHTAADTEDKGFDELRRRAHALGADAVIGAEFAHGDGSEPSHLSGMAIRYIEPLKPYYAIGMVEIDTPEDSPNKGLDALLKKAHAMGADQVVGVGFQHGEGKEPSRLIGTAVKWRPPRAE